MSPCHGDPLGDAMVVIAADRVRGMVHRPANASARVGPVVDQVSQAKADVEGLVDRREGRPSSHECRRRPESSCSGSLCSAWREEECTRKRPKGNVHSTRARRLSGRHQSHRSRPASGRTRAGTSRGSRAACDGRARPTGVRRSAARLLPGGKSPCRSSRSRLKELVDQGSERAPQPAPPPGCQNPSWGGSGSTPAADSRRPA